MWWWVWCGIYGECLCGVFVGGVGGGVLGGVCVWFLGGGGCWGGGVGGSGGVGGGGSVLYGVGIECVVGGWLFRCFGFWLLFLGVVWRWMCVFVVWVLDVGGLLLRGWFGLGCLWLLVVFWVFGEFWKSECFRWILFNWFWKS